MNTKEEILKRLKDIEESLFLIDMVDRWQEEDKNAYYRLTKEKQELEKKLEEL